MALDEVMIVNPVTVKETPALGLDQVTDPQVIHQIWNYTNPWEAWRIIAAFWFFHEVDQLLRKAAKVDWALATRGAWLKARDWVDAIGDFVFPSLVSWFIVVRWLT